MMIRHYRSIATVALVAIGTFAVLQIRAGQGAADEPSSDEFTPAVLSRQLMELAPPAQRTALEDEVVTRGEYLAAVEATQQCLGDHGHPVTATWDDGNYRRFSYGTADSLDKLQGKTRSYNECYEEHMIHVDMVWSFQDQWGKGPSPEAIASAREALGSCLLNAGVLSESEATNIEEVQSAMLREPQVAVNCSMEVEHQFGFAP